MKKIIFFTLIIASGIGFSQGLLNGLQACYPLDCNANNYAVSSATLPSLNGIQYNVSCTNGHLNSPNTAIQFHGDTTSYIELPPDLRLKPNALSISGWFYIDTLNAEQYLIFTKNNCNFNFEAYYFTVINSGSQHVFRVGKAGSNCGVVNLDAVTLPVINTWYHVVFYIDNSVIKLYINGILDNSLTHSTAFDYSTKSIFLSGTKEWPAVSFPFKGRMDNLRFYDRELTPPEVSSLYAQDAACSPSPAPISQFSVSTDHVCKGQSITLSDQSTNNPTSWNWQMPGASPPTSTLTNPVVSYPNPGIYTISLIASNSGGAGSLVTKTLQVLACVSITELSNTNLDVMTYPNPTDGSIFLRSTKNMSFAIYDATGKTVNFTYKQKDDLTDEIKLEEEITGLYFLKISDPASNRFQILKIAVVGQ